LQYDAAATLLRRGLAAATPAALDDSARAAIDVYIGAAETFRGQRDAATSAFLAALAADPRQRPDKLIFPPAVTDAFDVARRLTQYVRLRAASDTTIGLGRDAYVTRLYASAPHDVTVQI